ncbi:MAG: hypothetical protein LBT40_06505, partial [Deltaproteobacteria bacterium]|nr:hypothetical protein [Deltaproteobacteria bacterium]
GEPGASGRADGAGDGEPGASGRADGAGDGESGASGRADGAGDGERPDGLTGQGHFRKARDPPVPREDSHGARLRERLGGRPGQGPVHVHVTVRGNR